MSDHALEMIMRDVLDGIEDLSLSEGFKDRDFGMKILSIEPESENLNRQMEQDLKAKEEKRSAEIIYPAQFKGMAS